MTEPARAWDVVVMGGLNSDFVVRGPELPAAGMSRDGDRFVAAPGGKGANAAVAAARLGARTALIGRVGDDERGRALLAPVAHEGVHVDHVSLDREAPTGAAVIHVDRTGEKQVLAALGANLRLPVQAVDDAARLIRSCGVLLMQLEVPVACVVAAARIARSAGVQVVLDPAPPRALPAELLGLVNVVRGNAMEIGALTSVRVHDKASAAASARALLTRGITAVLVSVEGGNLLVWGDGEEWLPKLRVKPVDSTGAGDAFSAAFAVALAERQRWPRPRDSRAARPLWRRLPSARRPGCHAERS